MVLAAASFIGFLGTDHDNRVVVAGRLAIHEALGTAGIFTTNDANGMEFGYLFGDGEELGNRAKRFTTKVHIEASKYDANTTRGKLLDDTHNFRIKELNFINGDDGGGGCEIIEDFVRFGDGKGFNILAAVAANMKDTIAIIDAGFKDLYALFGDDGTAGTANEFLAFSTKHAAANDLNTA